MGCGPHRGGVRGVGNRQQHHPETHPEGPGAIVRFKALGATAINVGVALVLRSADWPAGRVVAAALPLGALSYGASILLDAYALRLLGAAREAALFATAPFAGALVAIVVLDDPMT